VVLLNSKQPHLTDEHFYNTCLVILGISHNVVSFLILVSYFLSNHPKMPSIKDNAAYIKYSFRLHVIIFFIFLSIRKLIGQKSDEEEEETEEVNHISKLDVHFFSFKTFYYTVNS
jgi:inositol 1,4,5-triphosphate receptor type 1